MTKTWFDGKNIITQEIPEAEIYKPSMTDREALKLALEALGEIEWSNNSQWQSDRAKVAITAIKEALAQPEERNFCSRCGKRLASGFVEISIHTCTPPKEKP